MFFFLSHSLTHSLIRAVAAVNRRRDPPPRRDPAAPAPSPAHGAPAHSARAHTAPRALTLACARVHAAAPTPSPPQPRPRRTSCPRRAPAASPPCFPSSCPHRAPVASPPCVPLPCPRRLAPRPADSSATRRFVRDPSSRPLGMIRFNIVLIRLIFSFLVLNLCTCMIRLILSIDDCRPSCR
jgi:hypothetical protein